ncbi:MAG: hypothetical protein JWO38_1759 [Gemmataceae bacterium]|nr:hypothetical protein [Gemmataceae bacterium]
MGLFISILRWAAVATGLIPASGRKKYRVQIFDEDIGTFELPFTVGESVTSAPAGPPVRQLLTRPFKIRLFDDDVFYWAEPDRGDTTEVVIWEPKTADEVAEADRFYNAAHGLGPGGVPLPGTTRPLARRPEDELRLIEATRADPDADRPYLDYAAWLTARHDPRGEFIRLTIELARLPADHPDRERLDGRRHHLISRYGARWVRPLTDLGFFPGLLLPMDVATFLPDIWLDKKGVVLELEVETAGVLVMPARADRLFSAAPFLRSLTIGYQGARLADFAAIPELAQLDAFSLSWAETTEDGVLAFVQSPYLAGLKKLTLSSTRLGPEGGLYLGQSPSLGQLRSLDVRSCGLGDEGVRALVAFPVCARLTELNLSSNELTDDALRGIGGSPHLAALASLYLEGNAFTADGVRALAGAAFLPTLTTLHLGSTGLDVDAARALAGVRFEKLTALHLTATSIGDDGFRALVDAPFFRGLQVLEAGYAGVGDDGAEALAGIGFTALRELSFDRGEFSTGTGISARGMTALAGSRALTRVQKLSVMGNPIGAAGARALAQSDGLPELTELNLRDVDLGQEGADALARSPHFQKLTRLWVTTERVGEAGKKALLRRFGEDVVW